MIKLLLTMIGVLYVRLLGWSTRYRVIGAGKLPAGSFIYAFWHSRLMFLVYSHRGKAINVLVSKSRDGQIISDIMDQFGFRTIRGSTAKAGARSAIEMIRYLKNKKGICAIAPDGPKGPRNEVKEGLTRIAQKTGCPIVPLAYSTKRKKILNTWDKFFLPMPFNKGVVLQGRPIYIKKTEELQQANQKICRAIDLLTSQADQIAGKL